VDPCGLNVTMPPENIVEDYSITAGTVVKRLLRRSTRTSAIRAKWALI